MEAGSLVNFCIPLLPKARAQDWATVCELLEQTLTSLDGQSNRNFRVIMAVHDVPDLKRDYDFEIRMLEAKWAVEDTSSDKLRDKRRKKIMLYQEVRAVGGGFAMQLDADDLVSSRLVNYVLEQDDPNGYIVDRGYAFDWSARSLAPIPGVFSKSFDSVCGSCAIIRYAPEDLPMPRDQDKSRLYYQLKQHAHYAEVMESFGRPLSHIPFPGAVYVLNHDNNLHFTIATDRVTRIPRQIRKHQIELTPELRREFALPE